MVQDAFLKGALKRLKGMKPPEPPPDESDSDDSDDSDEELTKKKKGKQPARKPLPPQAAPSGSSEHSSAPSSQQGGASKRKSTQNSDSEEDEAFNQQCEAEYRKRQALPKNNEQLEMDSTFNTLFENIEKHKKEITVVDEVDIIEAPTQPLPSTPPTGRAAKGRARRGAASKSPSKSPAAAKAAPGKRYIFTVKQADVNDATPRRMNENDPMSKIMEAYAKHNNLDVGCLIFFDPDGTPVKPDQLCKTLMDLEDEPETNELTCAFAKGKAPAAAAAPAADRPGRRFIFTVKQKDVVGENKMRIHEDDPMSKLIKAFCKNHSLDENSIQFKFDGQIVQPNTAAKALDPEEEPEVNQIDAMFKQAGKGAKRK